MNISFIIPAYNEQEHITDVIRSINTVMDNVPYTYEIIVVDDASTDDTCSLTKHTNARLITLNQRVYVAQVRNIGAANAKGNILVFLDGDVLLTPEWGQEIQNVHETVLNGRVVTGSVVAIPEKTTWVVRSWFTPILNKQRNYINSGHLIVSQTLFNQIGGFDETLETGEDSDFSARAKKQLNASIINNPQLKAIHLGYPETIPVFFKRERWHGKGNFKSIKNSLTTKVPLIILTLWLTLGVGIALLLTGNIAGMVGFILYATCVSLLFAVQRCGTLNANIVPCSLLSLIWLTARGTSLVDVIYQQIRVQVR